MRAIYSKSSLLSILFSVALLTFLQFINSAEEEETRSLRTTERSRKTLKILMGLAVGMTKGQFSNLLALPIVR